MERFCVLLLWMTLSLKITANSMNSDSEIRYTFRETKQGRVRGVTQQVLGRNVSIFLGIPFAQPPIGELRFKRPEPPSKRSFTFNATQLPPSCYQQIDTTFDRFQGVDMWNPNTERSEDCLYLNVWQPDSASSPSSSSIARKAVMVWIYGGGFNSGTSTLELYDGKILASKGDVVVVSMQYRLGSLGFLYLGTPEAPGNQGLLDQNLALQWVSQNIEYFGGDPSRVTLFGESAGACSVSLHLISPLSRDLIKSGIMQSATALSPWGVVLPDIAKKKALELAELVGCSNMRQNEMLKCLQRIDPDRISNEQLRVNVDNTCLRIPFVATIDNYFLSDMPIEMLQKKNTKQSSILLGVNEDEGFYFLAYQHQHHFGVNPSKDVTAEDYVSIGRGIVSSQKSEANLLTDSVLFEYAAPYYSKNSSLYRKVLDDIMGDVLFKCPVVDFALAYAAIPNIEVYVYNFNHRTSANPWPIRMGVMHGYEIDHVFGMPLNASLNYTRGEHQLSDEMIRYWTNFAKTGNPNVNDDVSHDNKKNVWPTYKQNDRQVLLLESQQIKAQDGLRDRQCDYWRSIVPKLRNAVNAGASNSGTFTSGTRTTPTVLFIAILSIVIISLKA